MTTHSRIPAGRARRSRSSAILWTLQGLLAALFLFAGVMKLVLPAQVLTSQSHLSAPFLRFIGVCEALGAVGLILPGLLRIRTELTPLAAAGLVIIMIGAVAVTVASMGFAPAVFPLVVGAFTTAVAYGRWRRSPLPTSRRAQALSAAA
jgi:uncharacterized membrane protein YphA (DoxX/SURF4 family)